MSKIYNISILGSGRMATEYARLINSINNIKICNVYSRNLLNAKKFAKKFEIPKYTNIKEDIFKEKIDGVIVCVSADMIFNVVKNILKYKKPLLIEKPIGLSSSEVKILNKINLKYKTPNLIGLNRRYYSSFLSLERKLRSKNYRGFSIEGHEHIDRIKRLVKKSLLNKWLYANSIHTVNLIDYFSLSKKFKLESFTNNYLYDKNISCITKSDNNILGSYISNWKSNESWTVRLFFNGYTIIFKPLEMTPHYYINKKKFTVKLSKFDQEFKPGLHNQILSFLNLIKKKKNSWPDENINSIIKTYKILDRIN